MGRLLACAGLALLAGCARPEIAVQTPEMVQVDGGPYAQARDMAQAACQRHGRNASFRQSIDVGGGVSPLVSRTFDCVAR